MDSQSTALRWLGLASFLFRVGNASGGSEAYGGWERLDLLTQAPIHAVTYGDQRFLALGQGVAVSSSDGIRWALELPPDFDASTRRLRYVGGRFVRIVVGTEIDAVGTSLDGRNWSPITPSTGRLRDVAFGNGRYVVVGDGGRIMDSVDGLTWRQRQAPVPLDLYGVEYGGGRFVACGPSRPGGLLNSVDGEGWEVVGTTTTPTLSAIAYGDGVFMALGADGPFRSVDGREWSAVQGPKIANQHLVYGLEEFVFGFNNTFPWLRNLVGRLPSNGGPATFVETETTAFFRDTAYGSGRYVVVGDNGTLLSAGSDFRWSVVHPTSSRVIVGLAFANGRYVAITTAGELLVSPNGVNWTAARLGESPDAPVGLSARPGGFLAVDGAGRVFDSVDGTQWNFLSRPANALSGIAYGNGTIIAFGPAKTLLTSVDGTSWHSHAAEMPTDRNAVAWGNGLFVAVGTGNTVFSPTGEVWTKRNAGTTQVLRGVVAGEGAFVAVGDAGSVVRSTDGQSWLRQNSGVTEDLKFVAYGGGRFVAVGNGGVILSSVDGLAWTREVSGMGSQLTTVARGTSEFLVGGAEGVLRSVAAGPRLSMTSSVDDSDWRVQLAGITGTQCALYGSSAKGPGGWISVTNVPVANPEAEVRVPKAAGQSAELFRAVVLP